MFMCRVFSTMEYFSAIKNNEIISFVSIWTDLEIIIGEGNGNPTPALLPGKYHGRRNLVGCSPWGRKESDTTERLHLHFSLLCIGGGNGNPLQCSCLENPRDGGAWCDAVYGVAQSRTWVKQLSSSSSSRDYHTKWSKSDTDTSYDSTYMCNLKIMTQMTYLQNRNRLTDLENELMVTKG